MYVQTTNKEWTFYPVTLWTKHNFLSQGTVTVFIRQSHGSLARGKNLI
jgi:hypothetical protein